MPSHQYYLAADLANPLAAIDIGSNSIRLIIAEGLRDGKYRILDDEKDTARLGAHLAESGRLSPAAVERSLETLRRMKKIVDGYQVGRVRAIATCAVREAEDGAEFCRRVQEEIGLEIEVVSAKQEGKLAFLSVQRHFDLSAIDVITADIGGGSTEIVAASGGVIEAIYTTPLGALRLSERLKSGERLSKAEFESLLHEIDRSLAAHVGKPAFVPHVLIGTGGTFTALASILMGIKGQLGTPIRGYTVRHAEVRHLLDRLSKMSPKMRRGVPGLSPERAEIIVAGLAIIDRILHYFGVNRLQVHTGGVRDGLLLTMVDQARGELPESITPHDRAAAVERFAAACSVDIPHSKHVGRLALEIFDQMREPFDLHADDRGLLESAALLQDVGYLINYEDHHKHSYHLIMNSDLPGFSPAELTMLANVARYHRGAMPKRKHESFSQLASDNQLRVRQMAAILRVAGGLDRSHSQRVEHISLELTNRTLRMIVTAAEEPEVDLWGAQRRTELFEQIFDVKVEIIYGGPRSQAAAS